MDRALFVSFWDIALDNIPEGTFVHRRLGADEARAWISEARRTGTLRGVSGDDLLAPDRSHEKRNHEELCRVLRNRYGIRLTIEDFLLRFHDEEEDTATICPLVLARVGDGGRLIVVSCLYTLPLRDRGDDRPQLRFDIDPESVSFHAFDSESGTATNALRSLHRARATDATFSSSERRSRRGAPTR